MGGGGERVALGLDQRLDALGRPVEAAGEGGDLVLALDRDAGGEVAPAQRLHLGLQPLQPLREPPRQRPGAGGDGKGEDGEGGEKADRRRVGQVRLRAHQDQATVRQRQGEGPAPPRAPNGGWLVGLGQGRAQAAVQPALRPEHGDTDVQIATQPGEGGIDLGPGRAGRRQRFRQQRADAPADFRVRHVVAGEPPAEGDEQAEEHDDAEQRQIDLEEEAPSHGPPSPLPSSCPCSSSSWRWAKR